MNKLLSTLVAGVMLTSVAVTANAATLSLTTTTPTIGIDETLVVDLEVSGLGNGVPPSLGAFDVDIGFDPEVLGFDGLTFGTLLGDIALFEAIDAGFPASGLVGPGLIDIVEVSLLSDFELDALQPDAFVLATLEFTTLENGETTIAIDAADPFLLLSDALGDEIAIDGLNDLEVEVVPEPATLALFGFGLAGLRILRRRKTATC